ncbi:MAG: diguanylate cyclase [Nitrospinae bacterium]|nr:diguanylate cyclase [Nitrospinota bacterium]
MRKRSLLLVDDEESIRASVSKDLRKAGYEVTVSDSGEDALKKYRETRFDVILTDLMMEGMDGIRLLKEAKQINPNAMVVILTGYGSMTTAIAAIEGGAFDYVLKPCQREELVVRLGRCIESLELQELVAQRTQELELANEELKRALEKHRELEKSLRESRDQLAENNKKLQRLSSLDGLTGIANRRFFDEYIAREWGLAIRQGIPISMVFIDVDYFKLYNDTLGHQEGDDCLKKIANVITKCLKRPADLSARYGGEEFVALLPGTDESGAEKIAEEIRAAVSAQRISHKHPTGDHVTVSLGVAAVVPQPGSPYASLIEAADVAMLKAKREGKDRVEKANMKPA